MLFNSTNAFTAGFLEKYFLKLLHERAFFEEAI